MNILLSDFVVSPSGTSESYIGWKWVEQLAQRGHHVWFMYHAYYDKEIKTTLEKYELLKNKLNSNIHPLPVQIPKKLMFFTSKYYLQFISYFIWQIRAFFVARKLLRTQSIDVIHHVTLGDYRMIGFLPFLNKPFFFGPVGGGQLIPKELRMYSKNHRLEEIFRTVFNRIAIYNPIYILAANRCRKIFSCNEETAEEIRKVIKYKEKVIVITENAIDLDDMYPQMKSSKNEDVVYILWVGRFIYRKGLEFLINVAAEIKNKNFRLVLCGDGKQKEYIERLVKNKNLTDKIIFTGHLTKDETYEWFGKSDIFAFPSLRETTGTVLFEAMFYELPIITFKQNGANVVLDDECAYRIELDDMKIMRENWVRIIELLIDNCDLRQRVGRNSRKKLEAEFTWYYKILQFEKFYLQS